MKLLLDIGNTHIHAALATSSRVQRPVHLEVSEIQSLAELAADQRVTEVALCSVAPRTEKRVVKILNQQGHVPVKLTHKNCGVSVDYPKPESIGPDRLANARAGLDEFGGPLVVVDFGTAVTFDIVDASGCYRGGVIAPGLSAMTDYLHEKTALLPAIQIKTPKRAIGRNTVEAMQIGAVHGYAGLIERVLSGIRAELGVRQLKAVATGGCARIMTTHCESIDVVRPRLTLDGLRLASNDWS